MQEYKKKGYRFAEEEEKGVKFDKNVITPGTEFMFRMSKCLEFYIMS